MHPGHVHLYEGCIQDFVCTPQALPLEDSMLCIHAAKGRAQQSAEEGSIIVSSTAADRSTAHMFTPAYLRRHLGTAQHVGQEALAAHVAAQGLARS